MIAIYHNLECSNHKGRILMWSGPILSYLIDNQWQMELCRPCDTGCRTFGPSYDPIGNESPLPESFRRTGMGHYWTGCVRRSSRSLVNINI